MSIKDQLDAAAVALAAVGSGSAESARTFVSDFGFKAEMYLDEELKAYRAFGLHRGVSNTLGLSSLRKGWAALKKGFRQGSRQGDLWQQGGLFVIGPGDRLDFAHRDRFAGDLADLTAMLAAAVNEAPPGVGPHGGAQHRNR
jgi:hypothetical protein